MNNLVEIEEKIEEKAKIEKKLSTRFVSFLFFVFVVFLVLSFLAGRYPSFKSHFFFMGCIVFLFALFIVIRSYPYLTSNYSNRERIVLGLIRISGRINNYLRDASSDKLQLEIAYSKNYALLKKRVEESISLYNKPFRIEEKYKSFLLELKNYLNSEIKEALKGNLKKRELFLVQKRLLDVARELYYGNLENAKKEVNNRKKRIIPHSLRDWILNISNVSHVIIVSLLISLSSFLLTFFPIKDWSGLAAFISLLFAFFAASYYPKLHSLLSGLIEVISLFLSQSESGKENK